MIEIKIQRQRGDIPKAMGIFYPLAEQHTELGKMANSFIEMINNMGLAKEVALGMAEVVPKEASKEEAKVEVPVESPKREEEPVSPSIAEENGYQLGVFGRAEAIRNEKPKKSFLQVAPTTI